MDSSKHTQQVTTFFDSNVAAYDAFYDPPSRLGRWFNRAFRKDVYRRRDMVLELARRFGCRSVLDVGCGSARNAIWWLRNGVERVWGVDVSAEMIEEARRLAAEAGVAGRCRFDCADFATLPPEGRFDIVAACGVFDYVEHAVPFLRTMAQHAERVIYGSFPGWTLVRSPLRKVRYALQGCPTHFYRERELRELFAAVGFGTFDMRRVDSGRLAWAVRETS